MLRIFQNSKSVISVCLATLLILVSTITIFPSTASADNNFIKNEIKIECTSDCGNIFSFAAGMVSGSAVTVIAITGQTGTLVATGAAIGQAAVAAMAPLTAVAGTVVSAPVLVPVAATAVAGYTAYQLLHNFSDNQNQNAN
jgi:hypothetical protein